MTKSPIKDRKLESSDFSRARLFARNQKSDPWESNKGMDFILSQNDLQVTTTCYEYAKTQGILILPTSPSLIIYEGESSGNQKDLRGRKT